MTDGDDSEPPALESPNNARDAAAATAKSAGNEVTPSISIKRGLYVGDINASFDKLRDDYVINITVWAYNGTGDSISFSAITGAIKALEAKSETEGSGTCLPANLHRHLR
jgi:hypothetical protein